MLNVPLLAAISLGGSAAEWLKGKNIGAGAIWRQVGARTMGRAAYSLNESRAVRSLTASSPLLGGLASSGLSKVASTGFGAKKAGYTDILKSRKKAQEDTHKRLGTVERGDYSTEAEFKAAQARARTYQEKYRANLPWTGNVGGVIGFMVDNRANRQSQVKLNKDADKQAKKDAKKSATDELGRVNKLINGLKVEDGTSDEELGPLLETVSKSARVNEARKTLGLESLAENAEQRVNEIRRMKESRQAAIKSWQEVAEKLRQVIKEGEEVENEERDSKILSKLEDLEKKESSGGTPDKK